MRRLRLKNSAARTAPVDPIPDKERASAGDRVVPTDNGAPMGAASQGLILVIAIGVVLVFVAFVAGMYVAERSAQEEERVSDFYDEVIDDTEGIFIGSEAEDIELAVEWLDVASQPQREAHVRFKRVVLADYLTADTQEISEISFVAYTLGTVRGGPYDGYSLTQQIAALPGLGTFYETYYLLVEDDSGSEDGLDKPDTVLVNQYATSVHELFLGPQQFDSAVNVLGETRVEELAASTIRVDYDVTIPELEYEFMVRDAQGRSLALTGSWQRADFPAPFAFVPTTTIMLNDGTKLSLYNPQDDDAVPAVGRHQFYRVSKDGRLVFYDARLPFLFSPAGGSDRMFDQLYVSGMPNVTWNDGVQNETVYVKAKLGGCGITTITNVLSDDDLAKMPARVKAGEAPDGTGGVVTIYEPETYDHPYYDSAFNTWTYNDAVDEKLTYADFVDKHPYIYFKDAFGRWVEMMSSDVVPAVECGKPVIYLYPEQEMDVDVRVEPAGGFSKTEPEYRDGWRVTASPDGRLVNRDDGREYPYLFWEGRGGMYAEPSDYWVVTRAQVPSFLRETLGRLGLNVRETEDFMEFWGPRMQSSPWYKIGFHGTRVMDMLAPMSLSVKPDSVLRVLMDYSELDAPVEARPPRVVPRFDRRGFTVVEWGGVLR